MTIDFTTMSYPEIRTLAKEAGYEGSSMKRQDLEGFLQAMSPAAVAPQTVQHSSDTAEEAPTDEAAPTKRSYNTVPRADVAHRRSANRAQVISILASATEPMGVSQINSLVTEAIPDTKWADTYKNVQEVGVLVVPEGRKKYQGILDDVISE